MKRLLTLILCASGALALSACETIPQTRLAEIPLDPSLRQRCTVPVLPADPVTPTDVMRFSLDQEAWGRCEANRADAAIAVIDAHNETARQP